MFTAPEIDWFAAWPVTAVLTAGVLGLLVEAFAPRSLRRPAQLGLVAIGLAAAFVGVVALWMSGLDRMVVENATLQDEAAGMVINRVTLFLQGALLFTGAMSMLVVAERGPSGELDSFSPQAAALQDSAYERQAYAAKLAHTEIFPLVMFAIGGMMAFASAADLLTMFVALEVFSLPLYILTGLERRRLLSQEAALKYFLTGAFSSALFIFGVALVYGLTNHISLTGIANSLAAYAESVPGDAPGGVTGSLPLAMIGLLFVLSGLLFKVGAVPFHSWTPDVYVGAPTPISGFMAACTKIAAFGALLRVSLDGFGSLGQMWTPVLVVVAALTMIVGSVVAIRQTSMKRILAYSSIAHAGFILTALVAIPPSTAALNDARSGVLFYLLAYGVATVAAFGMVSLVRQSDRDGTISGEAGNMDQWAGLGRTSPVFAAAFAIVMMTFAGIPLTAGFISKFGVFRAAVAGGHAWLAVLGVICSAIAAFFYFKVIRVLYFTQPKSRAVVVTGPLTAAAVGMGIVAIVVMGVVPGPVLDLTQSVVQAAAP